MDELLLASRMAELTALLSPTEGTPPEALDQVRRVLAEALLNGQSEPMEDPSDPSTAPTSINNLPQQELDELRRIVGDAIAAQRDPSLRIFRRTRLLLTTNVRQSVPAWASGWSPESSIGPFESAEGGLVWFDVRRTAAPVLLIDAQTERPLISLPRATLPAGPAAPGATVLRIPAGSVWLVATLFDSTSPAGSFAGLRVREGTLTLSHSAFIHGNTIRGAPGIVATLRLQLDPPERPPRSRYGGDALNVSADLPEEVTFTLNVGAGGRLVHVARATLEVYGNQLRLQNLDGATARYDSLLARLWFPMSVSRDVLSIDGARSKLFRPSGEAAIREAAWALPVAVPKGGDPFNLGEAAGTGALALSVAQGLQATLEPAESGKPLRLDSTFLLAEPGQLSVLTSSNEARYRRALDLWENGARGRSRIELQANAPLLLRFDAATGGRGAETLAISALECSIELDRPVTAAGERVPFSSRRATLNFQRLADVTRVSVAALADPPRDPVTGAAAPQPGVSFVLSNAFVRTSAALALRLNGVLDKQHQVNRGTLALRFALGFLLPSLPDPYAATMTRRTSRRLFPSDEPWRAPDRVFDPALNQSIPELAGRVRWATPTHPELSFELGTDAALTPGWRPIADAPIEREPAFGFTASQVRSPLPEVEARFPQATGQGPELFRLLDVSSRADLFGVGYSASGRSAESVSEEPLRLRGLELIAPARNVSAFTLPAFQWEPVYNLPAEDALSIFPTVLASPTDGGPARFAMPAATLVPVAPLPVLDTLLTEYDRQVDLTLAARFTLPFGIVAVAELRRRAFDPDLPSVVSPRFESVRPDFPASGLSGGQQLALHAQEHLFKKIGEPPPGLDGAAVQTNNGTGGYNVLKDGDVNLIFNTTFAGNMKMVPVQRIDFTGYGASTFSDWRRPDVKVPGVSQVKFEALVGRTAREVVQVRSKLYPWGVVVVRTITMERSGSGGVFRRDSGWQAASDGDYRFVDFVVHPGVVPRLTKVRRIRDTTNVYERVYPLVPDTVRMTQVVFDADVEVEGVTLGANDERRVPARDLIGYVQILPLDEELARDQFDDMLRATGPIGGPIDCELNVAQSGLHMRLSRIEVDRTTTLSGRPQFVLAARGSVELAGAGQWTFAYRGPSEPEPHRLEADRPIPLIRANPVGGVVPPYLFADPSELHRTANPHSEYGLLFSAGAQRMLLPQPQVRWGDATVHGGSALLFADMYALGGGVALFPRPDQCHPLPAGSALRITGRRKVRLDIPPQPPVAPGKPMGLGEFKVEGQRERTLSLSAALRVRSRFHPDSTIRLTIDSDQRPDWSCTYGHVALVSDIGDLEEVLQVVGFVSGSAVEAVELRDPQMKFGGPLAPVQEIIDLLKGFGLPLPIPVSLTNTTFSFKSGTKFIFPPPNPKGDHHGIPLGPGRALHLELVVGFGKEAENFVDSLEGAVPEALRQSALTGHGWYSSIECTAKVLAKVLHVGVLQADVGGALKFEFEAESHGKSEMTCFLGLTGVVELGLSKILSVSGGRTYSIVGRKEIGVAKYGLGYATEWEVEGVLLHGLAAVKLSFELLMLVERAPGDDFSFAGEATLAIDVTLGWVFTKTFEVEVVMSETLATAVFIATTVLPIK